MLSINVFIKHPDQSCFQPEHDGATELGFVKLPAIGDKLRKGLACPLPATHGIGEGCKRREQVSFHHSPGQKTGPKPWHTMRDVLHMCLLRVPVGHLRSCRYPEHLPIELLRHDLELI